jgi:hypothetical protein
LTEDFFLINLTKSLQDVKWKSVMRKSLEGRMEPFTLPLSPWGRGEG